MRPNKKKRKDKWDSSRGRGDGCNSRRFFKDEKLHNLTENFFSFFLDFPVSNSNCCEKAIFLFLVWMNRYTKQKLFCKNNLVRPSRPDKEPEWDAGPGEYPARSVPRAAVPRPLPPATAPPHHHHLSATPPPPSTPPLRALSGAERGLGRQRALHPLGRQRGQINAGPGPRRCRQTGAAAGRSGLAWRRRR